MMSHCNETVVDLEIEKYNLGYIIPMFTLLLISSIVGTFLNFLILLAVWRTPSLQTPSMLLLCSLAFSDFLIGALVQPSIAITLIAIHLRWCNAVQVLFNINVTSGYSLVAVSLLTLIVISVDRYLAISERLRYKIIVTKRRIFLVVSSMWIIVPSLVFTISYLRYFISFKSSIVFGGLLVSLFVILSFNSMSFYSLKKRMVTVSGPTSQTKIELASFTHESASTIQNCAHVSNIAGTSSKQQGQPTVNVDEASDNKEGKYFCKKRGLFSTRLLHQQEKSNNFLSTTASTRQASLTGNVKFLFGKDAFSSENASITDEKSTNQKILFDHVSESHDQAKNRTKDIKIFCNRRSNFNVSTYKRTFVTMVMVLVFCFLSYLPITVYSSIVDRDKIYREPVLIHSLEFIALLNSTLNPVIYLWRMRNLRRAVRKILHF